MRLATSTSSGSQDRAKNTILGLIAVLLVLGNQRQGHSGSLSCHLLTLATLPVIPGFQLVLSAIGIDILSVPRDPVGKPL